MKTLISRPLVFSLVAGSLLLTGCMSHYGPYGPGRGGEGMAGATDWEARHMEAHRHMMPYHQGYDCEMDGRMMWQGAGRGMGPGTGPGAGPGAGRGTGPGVGAMSLEQRRAVMAARLKNMPPEVVKQRMEMMEMDMQLMREHMASQPKAK